MKHIQIPALAHLDKNSCLFLVTEALEKLPQQAIDHMPWSVLPVKPEVVFTIAYHKDCIFLKYDVKEQSIQAKYRNTNDPVYKDSCVEFFIAFNGEQEYYNLEFNCLGTCRAGFGPNRNERKLLPLQKIATIKNRANLKIIHKTSRHITWQLTLAIPAAVFCKHNITDFKNAHVKVNFYKCGDELTEPHFLTWTNINSPEPNFHLPEYFGEMSFV